MIKGYQDRLFKIILLLICSQKDSACGHRIFTLFRRLIIIPHLYRENETCEETRQRLDKVRDHYHNQPVEKKEQKLANVRQKNQQYRGPTETPFRRSTRLEAMRANDRIQQAAKSSRARLKDAHEKWKIRYKK